MVASSGTTLVGIAGHLAMNDPTIKSDDFAHLRLLQQEAMARQSKIEGSWRAECNPVMLSPFDAALLGNLAWILDHDSQAARRWWSESVEMAIRRASLAMDSPKNDGGYYGIGQWDSGVPALAAADFSLAARFSAQVMFPKRDVYICSVHPYVVAMGPVWGCLMARNWAVSLRAADAFIHYAEKKARTELSIGLAARAIANRDAAAFAECLPLLIKTHVRFRASGMYKFYSADHNVSKIGVALVNIARSRGMAVPSSGPLIPEELCIPVAEQELSVT